jgi:general stress protein YciG
VSTKLRGFAAMDRARRRETARKGGQAAHEKGTAHEWTREEARVARHKGGSILLRSGDTVPRGPARPDER